MPKGALYIKVTFFVLISVFIAGYAYFRFENLLEGPQIAIHTPRNGETLNTPLLKLEGVATNVAFLTLNGRQIFVDEAGNIAEELLLSDGYNIVAVEAVDKFGRETKEYIELVYK